MVECKEEEEYDRLVMHVMVYKGVCNYKNQEFGLPPQIDNRITGNESL